MTRTLRLLAVVALLALMGAGCSNGSAKSGSTAGNQNATARDKAVKFAECMRENGYPDFPDPKASGEFPDIGISVTPTVWRKALGACKELQPPRSFSAHLSPEQMSAALEFAQCMRENGVKDFPDPVNGEPLVDTTRIPSSDTPEGMNILNAAMEQCGDVLGEEAGGQG